MKKMFILVIAWCVVGSVAPAQAQFIFTRPITSGPNTRPGGLPNSPYYSLYYGNPSAAPSLPPGMTPGGIGVPGMRPGMGVSTLPGFMGRGEEADMGPQATGALNGNGQDPNAGFVTGHPIGFQNYRGYFLNLNAGSEQSGIAAGSLGTGPNTGSIGIQAFGFLGLQSNISGTRPMRGRENLERRR
jgi:hypothetical protein